MHVIRAVAFTSLMFSPFYLGQTISTAQARAHEGETGTVCGKIVSEKTATSSRGEPTFINLDAAYPNQVFTILVWGDDRKNVGELYAFEQVHSFGASRVVLHSMHG